MSFTTWRDKLLKKFVGMPLVGIHIWNGRVMVVIDPQGTRYERDVGLPRDFWREPELLTEAVREPIAVAKIWRRPIVFLSKPFDTGDHVDAIVVEALKKAGARCVAVVKDPLVLAAGAGVWTWRFDGDEWPKRFYLLGNDVTTYLQFYFGMLPMREKDLGAIYPDLGVDRLCEEIDKMAAELPVELPADFFIKKAPKKYKGFVIAEWGKAIENRIYLTLPSKYREIREENLGDYHLCLSVDYENCVYQGLKVMINMAKPEN